MTEFIHHYLLLDFYNLIWPNIAASALLGGTGYLYGRAVERRAISRHKDMKQHITLEHLRSRYHLEQKLKESKP